MVRHKINDVSMMFDAVHPVEWLNEYSNRIECYNEVCDYMTGLIDDEVLVW